MDRGDKRREDEHIRFRCNYCGQKIRVPSLYAGKNGKCPKCKKPLEVPLLKVRPEEDELALIDIRAPEAGKTKTAPTDYEIDSSDERQKRLEEETEYLSSIYPTMVINKPQIAPERQMPWIIDIFLYPINKACLTIMGIVCGALFILGLVSWVVVFLLPIFLVGTIISLSIWFIRIVFTMYIYWYFCECIRDSAMGNIRAPETVAETPGVGDLFSQTYKTFGCLAVFLLPCIIYYLFTYQTNSIFWVLLGLGIFTFPMGLLAVIMFDSFSGLNPILIIGSIFSAFIPYCGLVLFLGAIVLLVRLIIPALALITAMDGFLGFVGLLLLYGAGVVNFYLLMIIGHLLGRFYFRYEKKLKWEV
jgi:hypothetical protein